MGVNITKRRAKKFFKKLRRQRMFYSSCTAAVWTILYHGNLHLWVSPRDMEAQYRSNADWQTSDVFFPEKDFHMPINICNTEVEPICIKVDVTRTLHIQKLLKDRGIAYEIKGTASNPINVHQRMRSPITIPSIISSRGSSYKPGSLNQNTFKHTCIDWNDFYPLEMIYEFMNKLEDSFPSICTVSSIGKTVEGRDIKMLKISNSNSKNTGVWLDGTIHAREWISTCVVTYIANHIAQNFNKLKDGVTNKDWYFVPVLNPDGYVYTHTHDRMWRKNRYRKGEVVCGVDLNRNFGLCWAQEDQEFSSVDPSHNNYHGPSAFSEPETSAVKDIILYSGIPFKIFISFHAYSEVIAFPWCFTSDPCPDYVDLLEGGTVMAKAIYKATGRMYKVGNFLDVMYSACGTSVDWSYGVAKIPFSYLVELRGKSHRFLLPKNEIQDCCEESLSAILALAKFVDAKKCHNCSVFLSETRNQS